MILYYCIIGTDMVNFSSFGGVLMPNYQEQNNPKFEVKMILILQKILTLLTLYKLTIKSITSMTCDKQVIVFMGKYVCFNFLVFNSFHFLMSPMI